MKHSPATRREARSSISPSATLLSSPVAPLAPARSRAALERLGLRRMADLLFFFPRTYDAFDESPPPENWQEGMRITVRGRLVSRQTRQLADGRTLSQIIVQTDGPAVRCVWFRTPHALARLEGARHVAVQGVLRLRRGIWEFHHPHVATLLPGQEPATGSLTPRYRLKEGLTQPLLRQLVRRAVEACADSLEEVLPESLRRARDLPGIAWAVRHIHFPASEDEVRQARRRFVYQELFCMQLALGLRRAALARAAQAPVLEPKPHINARIHRRFPFTLTADQKRAIDEIARDLSRPVPMSRLLQGDVGSGKTVVAQYAMLLAIAHGYQAVLMAPTEILAQQHARTLFSNLRASRVKKALLVGSLPEKERARVRAMLADGSLDLVIGTHAVCQEDIRFARLGLVVIDEQHRFGVWQRARLQRDACHPHYLVMTATPIPRTVALALYGDLDVSCLRESPPGRQPVHTYWVSPEKRPRPARRRPRDPLPAGRHRERRRTPATHHPVLRTP
ncbi:MAG TPA: DEAD/DEAH box helicase, partial [Bryobacterales bacterium]|nr:DEAD/DEAH box helicase [Bryobacterales bacterium]